MNQLRKWWAGVHKPALILGLLMISFAVGLSLPSTSHAQHTVWAGQVDVDGGAGAPTYQYYSPGQAPGDRMLLIGGGLMAGGALVPGGYGKAVVITGGLIGAVGAGQKAAAPHLNPPPGWYFQPGPPIGNSGPPPSGDVADNKDAFRVVAPGLRRH